MKRAIFLLAALLLVGCSSNSTSDGKLSVYASIYPVYDFATKIAGDRADVKLIIDSEPHGWEPSTKDMLDLEKANLFVYSGLGLESWVEKVLSSLDNSPVVVLATEGIDPLLSTHHHHKDEDEHEHDHDHGIYDPHAWLSPANAKVMLKNILDSFVATDAANKEYYEENYKKYIDELEKLDKEYREAGISGMTIVVSHEAYGYLCRDYNLKQIGIEGINSTTEPDPKTMAEIVELINENGIKSIYTEEKLNTRVADVIAEKTGATVIYLSPLESLSPDEKKNSDDYFSIMRNNLKALKDGANN